MTPLQQAAQAVVTRWDKTRYVMQDEMSALRDALSDEMAQAVEPAVSGATDGLSQDYNKGLGRWFADRLGARQQLRDDAHKAQQVAVPEGNWLWCKLMDFCKRRGYAPADFDDLFSIVGEARAQQVAAPDGYLSDLKVASREIEKINMHLNDLDKGEKT